MSPLLLALLFSAPTPPTVAVLLGDDTLHLPQRLLVRDARGLVLDAARIPTTGDRTPWSGVCDTLLGPVVLDTTRGPTPRIPDGARLWKQGNATSSAPELWLNEDRILQLRSGLFCLPEPGRLALSNADTATWLEACFEPVGRMRTGTLGSSLLQKLDVKPLLAHRAPGSRLVAGIFPSPPAHLMIPEQIPPGAIVPQNGRNPFSSRRWLDAQDRLLPLDSLIPWPGGASIVLRKLGGWIDMAWSIDPDGHATPVWLTVPGTRDTLFHPSRGEEYGTLSRPGWRITGTTFPLEDGWSHAPSPLRLHSTGGWKFGPDWKDLGWIRDGRTWKSAIREVHDRIGTDAPSPLPRSIPSDGPEPLHWTTTPPLLRTDSTTIEGLGTVVWTGKVSWTRSGTFLAQGLLRPQPRLRAALGRRILHVSVAIELRRTDGRDSAIVPRVPRVRFDSAEGLPLWKGARVASTGAPWSLFAQGDSLFLETDSSWQHEDLPGRTARPGRGSPSLLWTRGADTRILRGLSPLPDASPIFDSGTTEAVVGQGSTSFPVDDVVPDTSPLPRIALADWRDAMRPDARDTLFTWVAGNPGSDRLVLGGHPFVAAVVEAWNSHRPLRLSPDAVWMTLLEGLTTRVDKHPETCRADLVRHRRGKIGLDALLEPSHLLHLDQDSTWARLVDLLLARLDSHVVAGRGSELAPTFSTTTPARALATRGRILQLHAHYFDYRGFAMCGIPRVTLEGVPDDWKRLRQKARSLGACGLLSWTEQIDPVLEEFVRASEGHPSLSFWKAFVRFTPADPMCGSNPFVDGWISGLVPVDDQGDIRPFLDPLDLGTTPASAGTATIRLRALDGTWAPYKLRAGFSGVAQHADGSLFPELGWSAWKATAEPASKGPTTDK